MKSEIHEFPVGIYPRRLWVAVGGTSEDLSAFFGEKIGKFSDSANAVTLSVQKQEPKKLGGELIWFESRKAMTTTNLAHEAVHFALDVFDYTDCRISTDNQEPFAYLVGWAVKMMDMVRRKDYKED